MNIYCNNQNDQWIETSLNRLSPIFDLKHSWSNMLNVLIRKDHFGDNLKHQNYI
jgi:hypothetical protein